jgi:hypothetical protein
MIVVNDTNTQLCSGMKFQQRQAFGSKQRDGQVKRYPRGKVHMAPPGAHTWQPLCGEPLQDPAPRNMFGNNSVARQDADWCSGCVAVLFQASPADPCDTSAGHAQHPTPSP